MPSATTKRSYSLSTTKESSLCSRWSPTSLSPAASARIKAPNPPTRKEFHPHRRVSSESGLPGAHAFGQSRDRPCRASHLEDVLLLVGDHRIDVLHGLGHGVLD